MTALGASGTSLPGYGPCSADSEGIPKAVGEFSAEMSEGLIDLSRYQLQDLRLMDDTVLAHALRKVLEGADERQQPGISAFNSSVS